MSCPKYVQPLSKLILLLLHDFVLDEEESKQGCNEEIKGSNSRNNIIIVNVFILTNRVLRVAILYLLCFLWYIFILRVAEKGVIDQRLDKYSRYLQICSYEILGDGFQEIVKNNRKTISLIDDQIIGEITFSIAIDHINEQIIWTALAKE